VEGDTIDYFVDTTMTTSYPMLLHYLMIASTPYADLMIDLSITMATSYAASSTSMIALTPYDMEFLGLSWESLENSANKLMAEDLHQYEMSQE
jgi:hypothetical protein